MPDFRVGSTFSAPVPWGYKIHHSHRPWFATLGTQLGQHNWRVARWRLRLSELDFDVVHRAGVKYQRSDALSRLLTENVNNSALQHGLSVLLVEHSLKIDDSITPILGLEADTGVREQISDATDKTKVLSPTLAEFITDQAAVDVCQTTARQLCKVRSELNLSTRNAKYFAANQFMKHLKDKCMYHDVNSVPPRRSTHLFYSIPDIGACTTSASRLLLAYHGQKIALNRKQQSKLCTKRIHAQTQDP